MHDFDWTWLKKLFSEPTTLTAIFTSGFIGFVVSFMQGLVQKRFGDWAGFFGIMGTGISIAIIVGLGIQNYIQSEALRLSIVGACAVISDDIWLGLKTVGKSIRSDPLGTISRVLAALKGKKVTDPKKSSNGQEK